MSKRMIVWFLCLGGVAALALTTDVLAQRGGGGRGGGGGGRSAGHAAPSVPRHGNGGPAMSRPSGGAPSAHRNAGGVPNINKPVGGTARPNLGAGGVQPGGGFQRPTASNSPRPTVGTDRPNAPGRTDRPNVPGRTDRPNLPGGTDRPNVPARPGAGASSSQLNDFLGGGNQGVNRSGLRNEGRPNVGNDNRPRVGDRDNNSTNINVGDVNVGNSVDYTKNQRAWVDNHHTTGNQVRMNAGNRYASAYNNGAYRHGVVGGYPYYNGWNNRGAYYGWRPVTYAAFGTFMGAAWVSAKPRYYAYGAGGNVYYENNIVYVDGQAAGTPEEYATQSTAMVASAPAQVPDTEWLPLGTFALTREGVNDSQAILELAVNKQGVLAGTYYNEATQVSRSLKGMLDQASQRAAIGFADGINADVVLETGIQNLTQDEAPALLHQGKDRSGPVLLVRLQAPEEQQK